jgi:hypothetical protein
MSAPLTGLPCASTACARNLSVSPTTTLREDGVTMTRAMGDGAGWADCCCATKSSAKSAGMFGSL